METEKRSSYVFHVVWHEKVTYKFGEEETEALVCVAHPRVYYSFDEALISRRWYQEHLAEAIGTDAVLFADNHDDPRNPYVTKISGDDANQRFQAKPKTASIGPPLGWRGDPAEGVAS